MEQPLIALISDNPFEVDQIDMILVDAGYEYNDWYRYIDAYERCCHEQPTLVILDALDANPTESGWVLGALRGNPDTVSIPLIVCSAGTDRFQEYVNCGDNQRVAVLSRPYRRADLLHLVSATIGPPSSQWEQRHEDVFYSS